MFRTKLKVDHTLEKYKSMIVTKGFQQTKGMDFTKRFSPMMKPTTICIVLNLVLSKKWCIHQVDVNSTFLNGDIQEEKYRAQHNPKLPHYVCKLKKRQYMV